eukprot:6589932-Prymnesium_polylepis.1
MLWGVGPCHVSSEAQAQHGAVGIKKLLCMLGVAPMVSAGKSPPLPHTAPKGGFGRVKQAGPF